MLTISISFQYEFIIADLGHGFCFRKIGKSVMLDDLSWWFLQLKVNAAMRPSISAVNQTLFLS